ncbi:hypothetical protein ACFCW7_09255 [Paenibacillus glucanolyticus]|uniref:hypothetical protein n=1 Tax=Paenibacillus glucanolyticus TaxID=59843 RepID=UPI0035DB82C9
MFKRNKDTDFVYFGEQKVEIPTLTVGKWKLIMENLESLPQLLVNVLAAKGTDDFTARLVVGTSIALEEVVTLVAVVTGLDEQFIYDHADLNNLVDFITKTVKNNDLNEAAKKFRAMFAKINKAAENSVGTPR